MLSSKIFPGKKIKTMRNIKKASVVANIVEEEKIVSLHIRKHSNTLLNDAVTVLKKENGKNWTKGSNQVMMLRFLILSKTIQNVSRKAKMF